jgi:hypothetical protein
MCRLAYVHFDPSVPQDRRLKAVRACLRESWDLGNKDGAGLVTWTPGEETEPRASRAIKLSDLVYPEMGTDVLVHARASTNTKSIANTHPFARAGAYLVHNGIVSLGTKDAALQAKATTDNDSELILKAYLACERDFAQAAPRLSGWANVGIWDSERGVLVLYAHTSAFQVWRQAGITVVCQEGAQSRGIVTAGLGHPYESDSMDKERVVCIPMKEPLSDEAWVAAFRAGVKSAKSAKLAAGYTFATACASDLKAYRSTFKNSGPKTVIRGLANGAGWSINGRLYSNDGTPIDGFGRPLVGKKAAKAERVWNAVRKRAGKASGEALAGPKPSGGLCGSGRPRGRSYVPVRVCWRRDPHEHHAWGTYGVPGELWCPGSDPNPDDHDPRSED